MSRRGLGFVVLVVLLALLVAGYFRTRRDAGESPAPSQQAAEAGADDRLLLGSGQTDDLLRRIRTLALRSNVVLVRFRPREVEDDDLHRRWPIDLSVEAPYHGLVSFLDQVGQIGLVVPGDLDVVPTQGGPGITATLVLTAYLQLHP